MKCAPARTIISGYFNYHGWLHCLWLMNICCAYKNTTTLTKMSNKCWLISMRPTWKGVIWHLCRLWVEWCTWVTKTGNFFVRFCESTHRMIEFCIRSDIAVWRNQSGSTSLSANCSPTSLHQITVFLMSWAKDAELAIFQTEVRHAMSKNRIAGLLGTAGLFTALWLEGKTYFSIFQ